MRKVMAIVLATASLTAITTNAISGVNIRNGMDINGTSIIGGFRTGLNLSGVILPK